MFGYIIAAVLVTMAAMPARAQMVIEGPARVIDGDTIEIKGQRIRLHGIDAPESRQFCLSNQGAKYRCGNAATKALINILSLTFTKCLGASYDRYKRLIGRCYARGIFINAWLVENGWAVAYRKYSTDYSQQEAQARNARRGIWSGSFVMPWEWRRGKRLDGEGRISTGKTGTVIPKPQDRPSGRDAQD